MPDQHRTSFGVLPSTTSDDYVFHDTHLDTRLSRISNTSRTSGTPTISRNSTTSGTRFDWDLSRETITGQSQSFLSSSLRQSGSTCVGMETNFVTSSRTTPEDGDVCCTTPESDAFTTERVEDQTLWSGLIPLPTMVITNSNGHTLHSPSNSPGARGSSIQGFPSHVCSINQTDVVSEDQNQRELEHFDNSSIEIDILKTHTQGQTQSRSQSYSRSPSQPWSQSQKGDDDMDKKNGKSAQKQHKMKTFHYGLGSSPFVINASEETEGFLEAGYDPGFLGHNAFKGVDREEKYFVLNQQQYRYSFRFLIVVAVIINIVMGITEVFNSYAGWETDYTQFPFLLSLRAYQILHFAVTLYFSQDRFVHYNDINRFFFTFMITIDCLLIASLGNEPSFGVYGCLLFSLYVVTGMHLLLSTTISVLMMIGYIVLRYYVSVKAFVCTEEMLAQVNGQMYCDKRIIHMETELYSYFIYFAVMIIIMVVSMAITNRNSRFAFLQRERLRAEQSRTNSLLTNLLPPAVASRLISGQAHSDGRAHSIQDLICARRVKSCSILFCDIANFKALTFDVHPRELIAMLNTIFTKYDMLTERYDVYKVETVGEIYMIASGVPEAVEFHALELCSLALEMRALASLLIITKPSGERSSVLTRFGLHSGDVVAGTVGVKLPRYRLFGDTVNTASRMQSNAEVGTIQLSKAAYMHTAPLNCFQISSRGAIPVKGKGLMYTYILEGFKDPTCEPRFKADIDGSAIPANSRFVFPQDSVSFAMGSPLAQIFPSLASASNLEEIDSTHDDGKPDDIPLHGDNLKQNKIKSRRRRDNDKNRALRTSSSRISIRSTWAKKIGDDGSLPIQSTPSGIAHTYDQSPIHPGEEDRHTYPSLSFPTGSNRVDSDLYQDSHTLAQHNVSHNSSDSTPTPHASQLPSVHAKEYAAMQTDIPAQINFDDGDDTNSNRSIDTNTFTESSPWYRVLWHKLLCSSRTHDSCCAPSSSCCHGGTTGGSSCCGGTKKTSEMKFEYYPKRRRFCCRRPDEVHDDDEFGNIDENENIDENSMSRNGPKFHATAPKASSLLDILSSVAYREVQMELYDHNNKLKRTSNLPKDEKSCNDYLSEKKPEILTRQSFTDDTLSSSRFTPRTDVNDDQRLDMNSKDSETPWYFRVKEPTRGGRVDISQSQSSHMTHKALPPTRRRPVLSYVVADDVF